MIVDLHMIILGDENKDWLIKAKQSLEGQPINLIEIDGTQANPHIGQNRVKGFTSGTNEWVGFVDPDDWVEPEIYNKLVKVSEECPWANLITARDRVVDYLGREVLISSGIGHAFIARRSCIDLDIYSNAPVSSVGNIPMIRPCIYTDFIGYNYRMYNSPRNQLSRRVERR